MFHFWESVIYPILLKAEAKRIVEIGSDEGKHTELLLEYCKKVSGKLLAIDPMPRINEEEWKLKYGDALLEFHKELSLNALPYIKDYDAVLVDGDHNWYTVYNELKMIEKQAKDKPFPIVFIHDIGWPYGRRDLYYNPDTIPPYFQQPYRKQGVIPESRDLVENGGLNYNLNNSIHENNHKNGVLTAVEDFMDESSNSYTLLKFEGFHGLGLLLSAENKEIINFAENMIDQTALVKELEKERIALKLLINKQKFASKRELEKQQSLMVKAQKEEERKQSQLDEALQEKKLLIQEKARLEKQINALQYELKALAQASHAEENNSQENKALLNQKQIIIANKDKKINELQIAVDTHLHSIKYRIGNEIVESVKQPTRILKLPKNLVALYREGLSKKKGNAAPYIQSQPVVPSLSEKPLETSLIDESVFRKYISRTDDKHIILPDELKEDLLKSVIAKDILYPHSGEDQYLISLMEAYKENLTSKYLKEPESELVSIIMPTYNRSDVIMDAINSILKQSYRNWELLVVDDGSTDDTKQIIEQIGDNRIRYFRNEEKSGVSSSRNKGLQNAKGQYIAYLDSDNDWEEHYLLLMIHTCKEYGYESIYSAQKLYEVDNDSLTLKSVRFGLFNKSLLENRNYIDLNAYVHKKELYLDLGGFDESMTRLVDWDLILKYSNVSIPCALPCILGNYYFGKADNQITSQNKYKENLQVIQQKLASNRLNLKGTQNFKKDKKTPLLFSNVMQASIRSNVLNKVSIIIPSYETLKCLQLCIESIQKYTSAADYDLIIVDNNSSFGVKSYLRMLEQKGEAKVILNDHNMGFTYAVNQGIQLADPSTDIVLLNNDAIVTEGWLNGLYEVVKDVPDAGIVAPRQVLLPFTKTNTTHVPFCSESFEIDVNLSLHHNNISDPVTYAKKGYVQLSFVAFFCVLITRKTIQTVGLLDHENGRHYKSDRLYCQELAKHNLKLIYTPHAKLYHFLQQSTEELKKNPEMYKTIFVKNNWEDMKQQAE